MKVWLINPPSPDGHIYIRDLNRSGRRSKELTIWPQVSLAMIAGSLPEYECRIIDCIAERKNYAYLQAELRSGKPDWVIFNSISSTLTSDMLTSFYAKSVGAKTLSVGAHIGAKRIETLNQFPSCDYGISGRPENKIRRIITGKPCNKTFSELPSPRYDLLPKSKYHLPIIGNFMFVPLIRGCYNRCIFCRQNVTWKGKVEFRDPSQVRKEIEENGLKTVIFHADTATLDRRYMINLCKEIKPTGVKWICNSRVNTVDRHLLSYMKSAGCWMICYGIESGDNQVLKLNKKEATVEEAELAVKWTKDAGIKVWGYFMLGLYGDTRETMEKTVALSKRLPCDLVNFAVSSPYPGTEWNKIASKKGWINSSYWEDYDQNYSAIVCQANCPPSLVIQYIKKAYLSWYLRPYGIAKFLSMLKLSEIPFWLKLIRNHIR